MNPRIMVSAALISCVFSTLAVAQNPGIQRPQGSTALATQAEASPLRVLVLPAGETVLASPVQGQIVQVHTQLGASFRQGALLISMDCEEPKARLLIAEAELAATTDQHEAKLRMQGLEQASDVEVSLAASAAAKARAQVQLYRHEIAQCSIRAPWSGRTSKLHVRSHMTASAGQPLLDLVRNGLLQLKLNVPSGWVSSLRLDQSFDVSIDETGKTYRAKVNRINARVDPVSQTIEIQATMTQMHPDLLPGMSGVARFPGLR